ncbi:MAG: hypothetical protein K2O96_01780 [Lachnospiraceae bacterium]|nr:hypothetical protein [Lachnospiraceae bacterium]
MHINNLEQYFLEEYQFYLNKIIFEKEDEPIQEGEVCLHCTDSISAGLNDADGVKLIVTRKLNFEPDSLYNLEVSFGANLTFVEEEKMKIDWAQVDLAKEFKANGEFVLQNLLSRISLMISQITASFGQMPLITPPGIPANLEESN